jgi:hypothetical protein
MENKEGFYQKTIFLVKKESLLVIILINSFQLV